MKNPIYRISITKFCEEKWETMLGEELHKFCLTCQKNVRNFEGFSAIEIIKFLESENENICGRFKTNQIEEINRILSKSNKKKINHKAASILIGTLLFGSSCSTNKLAIHEHYYRAQFEINNLVINSDSLVNLIIIGHIVDEDRNPIPFVNIQVDKVEKKQEPIGTIADRSGAFKLTIPRSSNYQNKLKINYVGYQSSYIELNQIENKEIEITMKESGIILGEVCIEKKK